MTTKKPVWLLENRQYHLENFKGVIEQSGWDVLALYNSDKYDKRFFGLFTLDGTEVSLEEIKDKYSVGIKTGSSMISNELYEAFEKKHVITVAHAILGLGVDKRAGIALNKFNKVRSIFPEVWLNEPFLKARYDKIKPENQKYVYKSKTHPMTDIIFVKPKADIKFEENSLALLMTFSSYLSNTFNRVIEAAKRSGKHFDTIYVKRHPATSNTRDKLIEPLLEICDNVVNYDKHDFKYDLTDKCKYLATGSSSMFAETHLRNNLYGLNQKIFCFEDRTGSEPLALRDSIHKDLSGIHDITKIESFDIDTDWHVYDDLLKLKTKENVYDVWLNDINNIIEGLDNE